MTSLFSKGATMKATKRKKLEAAGWKFGDAAEFLQLTPQEAAYIESMMESAQCLRESREETQRRPPGRPKRAE